MGVRKIADYTITRELGRGGMGTVYQALSPEGATVAVKTVLLPENVDPRARWEAIERFQREARAARSLNHPNICQVLDFGADEDSLYIVMEFLDGQTVRDMIGFAGAIKMDRAVEILCSVGEALAHAHGQGIVHRDIKPENIMILRGGQTKLTDFGLASVASQQTMTMPGTTMGTMFYMSPEQVRGEKVDARSDIFSLGATFYEMLTGVRAFQAEEPAAVMNQILTRDTPPIPGLPVHVSQALEGCLRKDPGERYQSTREMITSLSAIEPETTTGPTAVLPAAQPTPATAADAPTPPPGLGSPEAEEADVRRRANFRYEPDFEKDREDLDIGRRPGGLITVEGGACVLAANGGDVPLESNLRLPGPVTDFVVEVRIARLEATGEGHRTTGIRFGDPGATYSYYVFIRGDGALSIAKARQVRWTRLRGLSAVPGLNPGNAENVLKVVRRGQSLHVFVNDRHVVSADDFDIRAGDLALTLGQVRAAFSELRVEAVSVQALRERLHRHWERLETREARGLIEQMATYDEYAAWLFDRELLSARPDVRETVLIVVGSSAESQLGDGVSAARLREEINRRGEGHEFRWAGIVTDAAVLAQEQYLQCPLIAIGPPEENKVVARLREELSPKPGTPEGTLEVYHDIAGGERRVAFWGVAVGRKPTAEAVDLFISSGLLDKFLEMIWEGG